MRLIAAFAALLIAVALFDSAAPARAASTLNRPEDPVVLTGADVPALQGAAPSAIVAFRYLGGWQQVPVQVDERFVQTLSAIYNNTPPPTSTTNINVLVYADPNTFTGADPNPNLDADDEIAFMAKDAGDQAPNVAPPGHTVAGSGLAVAITDPLQPGASGWVYLFRQDGTLDPGAGASYVTYAFNLLSGAYETTYHLNDGPNPENSSVTTPSYAMHFGDRWLEDELHITAGAASGADILDRHKVLFAPGYCGRSEDTFDNGDASNYPGEGAFIVNKSGPVRAIRSYVGANSGPNTEREEVFYAQRADIRTDLRVHAIPSVMDFFDYNANATGMTYRNDLNTGGVTIDGVPDTVAAGQVQWEMVNGTPGSLIMSGSYATNIAGFAYTSYYEDNSTTPTTQCTGDPFAYGASGPYINTAIPCTDPGLGCTTTLHSVRTMYFEPPGATVADAQALDARARTPLAYSISPLSPPSVGGVAQLVGVAAQGRHGAGATPWGVAGAMCALLVLGIAAAWRTAAGRRG